MEKTSTHGIAWLEFEMLSQKKKKNLAHKQLLSLLRISQK